MTQPQFNFDCLQELIDNLPSSGTQSARNDLGLQTSSNSSSHPQVTESFMALLRDATSSPEDQNSTETDRLDANSAASQGTSDLLSSPAEQSSLLNDNFESPASLAPTTLSSPPTFYQPTPPQLPTISPFQTFPQLPTSSLPQNFPHPPGFYPQAVYSHLPDAFNSVAPSSAPTPQFHWQAPSQGPDASVRSEVNGFAPNTGCPPFSPHIAYYPRSQQPSAFHHRDQNFPPPYSVNMYSNSIFAQYPGAAVGQPMHVMYNQPQAQLVQHDFHNHFSSSFPTQANIAGPSRQPRQLPLCPAPYYINQGHPHAALVPADVAMVNHDEQRMGSTGKWQDVRPRPRGAKKVQRNPTPESATESEPAQSPPEFVAIPWVPTPDSPSERPRPRPRRSARPNPNDPITCRLPAVHGPGLCNTQFANARAMMDHIMASRVNKGHGMATTKAKKTPATTRVCEWEGECPSYPGAELAVGNLFRHIGTIHGGMSRT